MNIFGESSVNGALLGSSSSTTYIQAGGAKRIKVTSNFTDMSGPVQITGGDLLLNTGVSLDTSEAETLNIGDLNTTGVNIGNVAGTNTIIGPLNCDALDVNGKLTVASGGGCCELELDAPALVDSWTWETVPVEPDLSFTIDKLKVVSLPESANLTAPLGVRTTETFDVNATVEISMMYITSNLQHHFGVVDAAWGAANSLVSSSVWYLSTYSYVFTPPNIFFRYEEKGQTPVNSPVADLIGVYDCNRVIYSAGTLSYYANDVLLDSYTAQNLPVSGNLRFFHASEGIGFFKISILPSAATISGKTSGFNVVTGNQSLASFQTEGIGFYPPVSISKPLTCRDVIMDNLTLNTDFKYEQGLLEFFSEAATGTAVTAAPIQLGMGVSVEVTHAIGLSATSAGVVTYSGNRRRICNCGVNISFFCNKKAKIHLCVISSNTVRYPLFTNSGINFPAGTIQASVIEVEYETPTANNDISTAMQFFWDADPADTITVYVASGDTPTLTTSHINFFALFTPNTIP